MSLKRSVCFLVYRVFKTLKGDGPKVPVQEQRVVMRLATRAVQASAPQQIKASEEVKASVSSPVISPSPSPGLPAPVPPSPSPPSPSPFPPSPSPPSPSPPGTPPVSSVPAKTAQAAVVHATADTDAAAGASQARQRKQVRCLGLGAMHVAISHVQGSYMSSPCMWLSHMCRVPT